MARGYFGAAVYHPKHEVNIGSLWRSAAAYGAAFVATVGRRYEHRQASDTHKTTLHTPLMHYHDMDDLLTHLPHSCPLVGVELHLSATPLPWFWHPTRALYLLGAEDHGLPPRVMDRCHYLISIPSVQPWSLNVANAGSIVFAHRHLQRLPGE
jgi:tRNA G18 (ribose-2'-O)-methylase SpoU